MRRILILGGYGNFGKRIAEGLSDAADIEILIAGRSQDKAQKICDQLAQGFTHLGYLPVAMDVMAGGFENQLAELAPFIVVHTSGPFQGQDHRVPKACIAAGAHYIDLADDRHFVVDIQQLDSEAKAAGVMLVSGASSVPGLSSAVVQHFLPQFSQLHTIDVAIAPGNKAERGAATVRGF